MTNNIEFCKLAVANKTWNKPVLESVYRDIDKLVATDGHRLHWVSNQPPIDKPFLLSGEDYQYPDYRQVFPKNSVVVATFKMSKANIKTLKVFCELLSSYNDKKIKPILATIKLGDNKLKIVANSFDKYHLDIEFYSIVTTPCEFSLNLRYFYDAVCLFPDQVIGIKLSNSEAPLQLDIGEDKHAIIMPMRLSE